MFSEWIVSSISGIQYNSGDGYVFSSSQLESLATGTTPQTRIGNRIDLLGIRINYMIWYEGCASASTYQTMVNQLTTNLKVVVLQLKEIKGDNSLYTWQNVKADYTNNGIVFLDNDITLDSGNNQGNRKRWNIIWEKRFTLQQAQESVVYPPTGSPTVKQQAPMYPNMIKGTKWIPAKKLMPVEYNPYSYEATTGTETGGIVTCVISNRINNVNRNDVYFIGDAVENDLITKAYPKIKDNYLNIGRLDDRLLGGEGMTDDLGDIALHKNLTENGNINTKNLKSMLLHEIQHNIQQREG